MFENFLEINILPENKQFEYLCTRTRLPAKWKVRTDRVLGFLNELENSNFKSRAQNLFQKGFYFGLSSYQWNLVECKLKTHPSAIKNFEICDKYFTEELINKRLTCDDKFKPFAWIPFSVVYKGGKHRVVFNYSWPENGRSINSFVSDSYAKVKLPNSERVAKLIKKCGKNGYIGKADLKSAFRQIILAGDDRYKCAYKWRGHTLVEHYMPWGTRAASAQCQLMGETILAAVEKELPGELCGFCFNYIDDFIFGGTCKNNCLFLMNKFFEKCSFFGFTVKDIKTIWPTIAEELLGFWYSCPLQMTSLTDEKLKQWTTMLIRMIEIQEIIYSILESFISKLEFGAPVVYPLKCCIRRFRNALVSPRDPNAVIKITKRMKKEAQLWLKLLPVLNGVKIDNLIYEPSIDISVEGDASNIACGAFWEPHWFSESFKPHEVISSPDENNIAWRETFVISCSFAAWAPLWSGKRVRFKTDNKTVHAEIAKKDSRNDERLNLIRQICFLSAKYRFRFFIVWVKRDFNQFADALSKCELYKFTNLCRKNNRTYDTRQTLFDRPEYLD